MPQRVLGEVRGSIDDPTQARIKTEGMMLTMWSKMWFKMLFKKRAAPIALMVLTLGGLTARAGQEQKPGQERKQEKDDTIRLTSDLVSLNASVVDARGHAIEGLEARDFDVYEDGTRQTIANFSATSEPFTLMLLIDVSGSTAQEVDLMKDAARSFLEHVGPDDRIGVIVFSNEVVEIAEITDSREQVLKEIDGINTTGGAAGHRFSQNTGTSFYDALYLAVNESSLKQATGRKAIIIMSDGVDSTSRMRFAEVARAVGASKASVFVLSLDTEKANLQAVLKPRSDPGYANFSQSQVDRYFDRFDRGSSERYLPRDMLREDLRRRINKGLYEIARTELSELADKTGGQIYPVRTVWDLAGVYGQIAADLRTLYSIGYYSTNEAKDGKWRSIRLVVGRPGAKARTRPGYYGSNQ
jgi:Ca-activated chloride channel family protein